MKILAYRDLKSTEGLLPLLDQAFRWTYNPRTFKKFVKIDPRLKNGAVGFCAVEDGSVVGFVGVLDIATRTLDGNLEHVGGIYGVATMPRYTRKGISTMLMNNAHQYFKDKGYRFSFLTTSHTIIAHSFYEKLGYTDLLHSPSAYKVLKTKRAKSTAKEKPAKLDFDKILKIYNQYMKGKTGLVVRDKTDLEVLKKGEGLTARQSIINDEGYVLFRKEKYGIWIRELVALNAKEMNKIVGLVEERARDLVYDRTVLDGILLQVYKSRGYMVQERSHGVIMVKPLATNASFKQTYGDKFSLTGLDLF